MGLLRNVAVLVVTISLMVGCAGVPVREGMKENLGVPAGKVEGNQFVGARYPFRVTAPAGWKMTMEFPEFLEEFGYEKPGPNDKEMTEVYLFHPATHSSVQIDVTPAGRYTTFSQEKIEGLATLATGSFKEELEKDYGKGIAVDVGPTQPVSLKGVQFAAKRQATYSIKGVKREQGWVYGFTEPYQLFILYMVVGDNQDDRDAIKRIFESFEVAPKK